MSTVRIFQVVTTLEAKSRKPGGLRGAEAIRRAEVNLDGLAESSLVLMDEALGRLCALLGDGRERPDAERMEGLRECAEEMLAYCAATRLPGMAEVLNRLCLMLDHLQANHFWSPGALDPPVNILQLIRAGHLPHASLSTALVGLEQCIERFSHAD